MAVAPNSIAVSGVKAPLNRPTGVRAMEQITGFVMSALSPYALRLSVRHGTGVDSGSTPADAPATGGILRRMLPYNLDHVALAVHDLDEAIVRFAGQYGVEPSHREVVEAQGVEEAMLPLGGSFLQLLQPLSPETPVGRFLERRGEGMHHVAFAVADIEAALAHLASTGARLIDEEPRIGGGGHRIAFVHPKEFAGTLIELVERTA